MPYAPIFLQMFKISIIYPWLIIGINHSQTIRIYEICFLKQGSQPCIQSIGYWIGNYNHCSYTKCTYIMNLMQCRILLHKNNIIHNNHLCDCQSYNRKGYLAIKPGLIHNFLHEKKSVPIQENESRYPFDWCVCDFYFMVWWRTFYF